MADPFKKLYNDIGDRKSKPGDLLPYTGGNGRVDRAVELIRSGDFPKMGALLDVGGAIGDLGYALRDLFSERWVFDIYEGHRSAANHKGNKFITCNIDQDGFMGMADESIDLIVALDFIEHILNPERFASECLRVLKPGGAVLINTPNIQFWRHLESLVVHGRFPHTSGDREVYHGGHVAFYGIHDMLSLFPAPKWNARVHHIEGLLADPSPPIWRHLLNSSLSAPEAASRQLDYADLIFSCRKPS